MKYTVPPRLWYDKRKRMIRRRYNVLTGRTIQEP